MKTTKAKDDKPKKATDEKSAARQWWDSLSQDERNLAMNQLIKSELSAELRNAISLATTYLDDGAPFSALRVLREALPNIWRIKM